MRLIVITAIALAAACGGAQTQPDAGRGWWCGETTDGGCYRAQQICMGETGNFCERRESAYCLHYEIPVENETGRFCRKTKTQCTTLQNSGLEAHYVVTAVCYRLE